MEQEIERKPTLKEAIKTGLVDSSEAYLLDENWAMASFSSGDGFAIWRKLFIGEGSPPRNGSAQGV